MNKPLNFRLLLALFLPRAAVILSLLGCLLSEGDLQEDVLALSEDSFYINWPVST